MIGMGELSNTRHPLRIRIFWALVYLSIIAGFVIGMYAAATRIRTHTLPVGQIQLTIPYSKYLVGETVSFTLTNNYNSPIYIINNCPSEPLAVYRLESGTWVRQHDQASINDCPVEQRQVSVPANGVVNGTFAPWHNLFSQPGKYRVVAYVEYYNALPYQEFEVIAQPAKQAAISAVVPATVTPYTVKQSKTIDTSYGSISVQYDTSYIYVILIAPNTANNCLYRGGNSGTIVQVTFICGEENRLQLQLSIVGNQIVVATIPNQDN